MLQQKTISVCIPTYNGAKALAKTLDFLVAEIARIENGHNEVEIVLTDDGSSDGTQGIIKSFATAHDYIHFFENEQNLGMDGNFRQAALSATGEFVWFSGQDDFFLPGSISHVLEIIKKDPALGLVYVNYSQYSEELGRNTCDSMFHRQVYEPAKIDFKQDLFFENGAEYFKFFIDAPTFLPATVMRREYWLNTDTEQFIGTHYIQYANILVNMGRCRIAAVTKPYILGLIPLDSWHKKGNFLFSVISGNMKAQTIVFRNYPGAFPDHLYFKKRRDFIRHFFRLALAAKLGGHQVSEKNKENLSYVFGQIFCRIYFFPILYLSAFFPNSFIKVLKKIKHNIFKD